LDINMTSKLLSTENIFTVTVKPLSIVPEGTAKNKWWMRESYFYGWCTGTRGSEWYLCTNIARGSDFTVFISHASARASLKINCSDLNYTFIWQLHKTKTDKRIWSTQNILVTYC
jgi:hypothetical protein